VREVLPFPTLQILFAKKLKNGMNCFSTDFRAHKIETVHWITTKIASTDPKCLGNVRTKALRTKKAERERERSGGEREGSKQRVQ
jgi:hypothetical protein